MIDDWNDELRRLVSVKVINPLFRLGITGELRESFSTLYIPDIGVIKRRDCLRSFTHYV